MRKIDENKTAIEKAAKTINFDYIVLKEIEKKAKESNTTVSHLVNMLCRRKLLNNVDFYRTLAKESYLEFQKWNYMKEEAMIEVKQ